MQNFSKCLSQLSIIPYVRMIEYATPWGLDHPDCLYLYAPLRGDARYLAEDYDRAIENYDIAIRRRENYFQYHLQRGLAHEKTGSDDEAITDLERSAEMFPTAIAYYSLGNLEAKRGNVDKAIEYYTPVAQSQGDIAKAAQEKLVLLDLERNPGKYVQYRCYADSNGELVVAIGNGTPVEIEDVRFAISFRDSTGVPRRLEESVRGPIGPGQRADRSIGIGPYSSGSGCPVEILSASVVE